MSVIAKTTTADGRPVEIIHVAPLSAPLASHRRIVGLIQTRHGPYPAVWMANGRDQFGFGDGGANGDLVIPPEWDLEAMADMVAVAPRVAKIAGVVLTAKSAGYSEDEIKRLVSAVEPSGRADFERCLRAGELGPMRSPAAKSADLPPKTPSAPSMAERPAKVADEGLVVASGLLDGGYGLERRFVPGIGMQEFAPAGGPAAAFYFRSPHQMDPGPTATGDAAVLPDPDHPWGETTTAASRAATDEAKLEAVRAAGRREVLAELAGKVLGEFERCSTDSTDILVLRTALEEAGMLPKRP